MSNTYFQFKQFTVQQDKSAMKVCTDACLFGAWVAHRVLPSLSVSAGILDIGAGTGLLSLMLAQKTAALIDAVEIDKDAFQQARENVAASPWKDRIRVVHGDVRSMNLTREYGLVVANPPFYENELRSPSSLSNTARHDATLTLKELLPVVAGALPESGSFAVLLPSHRTKYFIALSRSIGLFPVEMLFVKQTPRHAAFRTLLHCKRQPSPAEWIQETLIIREEGGYSEAFAALLKEYYLGE